MNKRIVVFILILASSLSMMSSDLYAPSLPHLAEFFDTSASNIKLTMSLNVLAYALATLVHGPLSERFGRRPVLLWGLASFTVFSFFCAISQNIEQLIVARVFQGISAAVEGVLVLAIIRDTFEEKDQVRVMALFGIASALTPAIAPVLGGYVHVLFGWRMNFHLLFVFGFLVTIAAWYFLEESSQKNPHALSLKTIVGEYSQLLQNGPFLKYCIISGAALGVFFAFITAGPFILINNHGLATESFGFFQCILVAGYMIGSYSATRLVKTIAIPRILNGGLVTLILSAALTLGLTFNGNDTIISLAVAMFFVSLAAGPIFATTPTLAMEASDGSTGSAAAMLVSFEMGFGALAALSVGILHDGSARPLGLTIAGLATCALMTYFIKQKQVA
ncbi:MAG: DHA1 family bicyclomycin/chloramphenicol resistance-like MFS transporter [Gammaproteobacteria bacterium]|jgi:DHA1 family bicyclomycin/chloramphenicol resistance-like MFS transporter